MQVAQDENEHGHVLVVENSMSRYVKQFGVIYFIGTGIIISLMVPAALITIYAVILGTLFNVGVVYAASTRVYRNFLSENKRFMTITEHAKLTNKAVSVAVVVSLILFVAITCLMFSVGLQLIINTNNYHGIGSLHALIVFVAVLFGQLVMWMKIPKSIDNANIYLANKSRVKNHNKAMREGVDD